MNDLLAKEMRGYKPLSFQDGKLILYKKGKLFEYRNNTITPLMRIGTTSWKNNFRITTRIFRFEPKSAKQIDDTNLLIVWQHKVILVDTKNKTSKIISRNRDDFSDPLNICIATEKWVAIWGDYGNNASREPVNIYGLKKDYSVEVIYQFAAGEIRHIHNIIADKDGYYIFTGDNEPHAGIYKADCEFHNVIAVKTGKQQYRAVIGFQLEKGLLFATDAVNEPNYLYLLKSNGDLEMVSPINGSCIYGKKIGKRYWFSTTVEPDETKQGFLALFSRKRGKGILSNEVHLIEVSDNLEVRIIFKLKKDIYPMKLMQYGTIQFPDGNDDDENWIYPVAVSKFDGCALSFKKHTL